MFDNPLAVAEVAGDLCIEDEKAGLQFGDMHPDVLTVFFEHALTSGFGHIALLTERGVSKHFADRHSGRFQATEKLDPDQHSYIVVPELSLSA